MPGRSGRPTPASAPSRWASAFTTVPRRAPGAGCRPRARTGPPRPPAPERERRPPRRPLAAHRSRPPAQHPPRPLDVARDRDPQRLGPAERLLAAQARDQLDHQPAPVEVAAEVEQMDLDRPPPAREGGPHADVEDALVRASVHLDRKSTRLN